MLLFADLLFGDLRGDLHGQAGDLTLQLVHGLAAFEFNFAAGLFAHRVGLRLRGGDDLLAGQLGRGNGTRGDLAGLGARGLEMRFIRLFGRLGVQLGLFGVGVEGIDLLLPLLEDLFYGLEQEPLEQVDLDEQVQDLCDQGPTVEVTRD